MSKQVDEKFIIPLVIPESGWEKIDLNSYSGSERSFLTAGSDSKKRLRLAFFKHRVNNHLVGKVWFGPYSEGPPNYVHGGCSSSVLDQAMGISIFFTGKIALTSKISVEFLEPIPVGTDCSIDAWVARRAHNVIYCKALLRDQKNHTFVNASGTFIELSDEQIRTIKKSF